MDYVVSVLCVVKLDVDCCLCAVYSEAGCGLCCLLLYVVKPAVEPSRPASVAADHRQYSIQALMLLAEVTVTLLDVVYRSEEKERVIPLLSNILYNVFPYLKNHRSQSIACFLTFIETVVIVRKFSIVSSFVIFILTLLLRWVTHLVSSIEIVFHASGGVNLQHVVIGGSIIIWCSSLQLSADVKFLSYFHLLSIPGAYGSALGSSFGCTSVVASSQGRICSNSSHVRALRGCGVSHAEHKEIAV